MKKLYQIFFIDEYNNAEELGWFTDPDDCIPQINDRIQIYGDYKIEKGSIRPAIGTFSEYIGVYIADLLEEKYGEEVYETFQSCFVRGFVNCLEDADYGIYKGLLVDDKITDLTNIEMSLDTLIDLIKKGQNKAILKYYNEKPKEFINNLMDSIIENTMKALSKEVKIDLDKYGIDKSSIHANDYWRVLEEDYDIENGKILQRVKNQDIMKCFNDELDLHELEHDFKYYEEEKAKYNYLGCYIFNLEMVEYYIHEDKLYTYLYTFFNDEKFLSQILIADKKENTLS